MPITQQLQSAPFVRARPHVTNLNVTNLSQLVRKDFPILSQVVNGHPLVYLDNAATTQKPRAVIERLAHYYQEENANVHRAVHELSARATRAYEDARETCRAFINANESAETIFTRGTTEGINLVAATWGRKYLQAGDEIVISTLEHHSNIVPWQMLCEATGARLRVIPINDAGELDLNAYAELLSAKTKSFRLCRFPMRWARSIRLSRSSKWRTARARKFWLMARKASRTRRLMCRK